MKLTKISLLMLIAASMACSPKSGSESESDHANHHDHAHHHEATPAEEDPSSAQKSLPMEEHAMLGNVHMTIKYTAPVVKGRVIFGGLVAFDEVWVTGAHRATSMEIDNPLKIGDVMVPAGKYAIFTIPGREEWTFILNRNWDQHLADDYNQSEDVFRMKLPAISLDETVERLRYEVIAAGEAEAELVISWDKTQIRVPLQFEGGDFF
jgi:hypothetical protein